MSAASASAAVAGRATGGGIGESGEGGASALNRKSGPDRATGASAARDAASAGGGAGAETASSSSAAAETTATAPNWLLGAREAATRRLDQTVDYDAACLTAFGQCEADLSSSGCAPCILSLVTEENDDDIDLPDDAEDWGCEQIVTFMKSRDFCPHIDPASHSATLLCSVWASCAQAVDTDGTPAPAAAPAAALPDTSVTARHDRAGVPGRTR